LIPALRIATDERGSRCGYKWGEKDIEMKFGERSFELVQCSVFCVGHTGLLEFITAANLIPIAIFLGPLGEVFPVRQSGNRQQKVD
jgi:hypothetical protein